MEDREGWVGDFTELRRCLGRAAEASRHMADWMRKQLGPERLPSDVLTLMEDISQAQSLESRLSDRLHTGPMDRLFRGNPMSREEFYLLVAMGVLIGGSCTGDPYDDFQMLRYEDDERHSYITLHQKPPGLVIHFGPYPEELSWERLRPEQREFFSRHMPELAARFKRDT
jgi:hypothetical protein